MKKNTPLPTETQQPNPFREAGEQLARMEKEGLLPQTFDLQAACADREFALLIEQYSTEAAVRIYDAEQRAALAEQNAKEKLQSQMQRRNALPKPQRGDSGISATPDYMSMSSEAFRNLESNLKKAAHRGSRVKI